MVWRQAYPAAACSQPLVLGRASVFLPCSRTVSVRVLVFALVVQLLLASAFIVWAASGFPLP